MISAALHRYVTISTTADGEGHSFVLDGDSSKPPTTAAEDGLDCRTIAKLRRLCKWCYPDCVRSPRSSGKLCYATYAGHWAPEQRAEAD
ncbi:hypothetical protein CTAM01_01814 [Colletotrichum tamarilloi]|uniref:Uncharacterized protein n=1 Tax=Colletotrichum tamarilloi TaxID=1209934 RepID=A0ABQ9RPM1_9PEZI|nr:uncharacterized protein CTAM01_01814 [Colletotrichum tamarilloi]KAK1509691.1 hypothetical protein CTAM01_01814 [Colletotrichum tamarilloi]